MSSSVQAASCANHPDRPAVHACSRCSAPICEPCSVEIVATGQKFCSMRCRDELPAEAGGHPVSNTALSEGLKRPIIGGWGLWWKAMGRIATLVLPVAVVAAATAAFLGRSAGDPTVPPDPGWIVLAGTSVMLGCIAFGVALVGVVLSGRHAALVDDAPYTVAARRFVPWLATWILMMGITFAGYIALIIPGIYLALRLFWADEFALIHHKNPIAALRASWELTRGKAAEVFVFQFILGFAQYAVIIPAVLVVVLLATGIAAIGWSRMAALSGIETFVFYFVGLVTYGALHGPEIVQFYGMRASKAILDSHATRDVAPRRSGVLVGIGAVAAAVVGLGVMAAIVVPNFLHGMNRGKQRRTYTDSREIAIAIETYAEAEGVYPSAEGITQLTELLVPEYVDGIPALDAWGNPFQVVSGPGGYEVRSAGKDGVFERLEPRGPTSDVNADMVWRNGELLQWPGDFEIE